jgi:hypothetical protein
LDHLRVVHDVAERRDVAAAAAATVSSAFLSVMATPKQNPWVLAFLISNDFLPQRADPFHEVVCPLRQVLAPRFPAERQIGWALHK